MKTKFKAMSLIATAVCAVVGTATVLSACSHDAGDGKKDYSAYTYATYAKEDWDSKSVAYQMYTDNTVQGPMGIEVEYLLNLYTDGGAALYQAGLWTTDSVENPHWYDQTNYIAYAYFGVWEESGDSIVIRMLGDVADRDAVVDMEQADSDWIKCIPSDRENEDKMGQTVQVNFSTTGDDAYTFKTSDYCYLPMGSSNKIMGAALQDNEGDGSNAKGSVTKLSSTVTYAKLADWVATYSGREMPEGQGGMA